MEPADEVLFEVGYEASTNHRMELLAVVQAIECVSENISSATVSGVQIVNAKPEAHDRSQMVRVLLLKDQVFRRTTDAPEPGR